MTESDKNRFSAMAESYDKMAQSFVPQYDFMQNEMLKIPGFDHNSIQTVVDLGAGSGIMLEKALNFFPNATGYWIDSSAAFLAVARKRLSEFESRVIYIESSLQDKWEEKIPAKIDLCTSMSAIHHLTAKDKKALYERIFRKLGIGGWFFNIDEMKSLTETAYKNSLLFWAYYVDNKKVNEKLRKHHDNFLVHFKRWQDRNITGFNKLKKEGDDLHDSFTDQIQWLEDAGFINCDLFIKYHLWCVIGGMKH